MSNLEPDPITRLERKIAELRAQHHQLMKELKEARRNAARILISEVRRDREHSK